MVNQYPDIIIFPGTNEVTEPYQNGNGDWVLPEPGQVEDITQKCRVEVNNSGSRVPGNDGGYIEYSFMIYLPVDTVEVPFDASIIIKNDKEEQIGKGKTKRFFRGKLNARLWV